MECKERITIALSRLVTLFVTNPNRYNSDTINIVLPWLGRV